MESDPPICVSSEVESIPQKPGYGSGWILSESGPDLPNLNSTFEKQEPDPTPEKQPGYGFYFYRILKFLITFLFDMIINKIDVLLPFYNYGQ